MPIQQFDERLVYQQNQALDDTAVVGTFQLLATFNAQDARIDTIQLSNSDSVDHHITLAFYNPAAAAAVFMVTVPTLSGWGTLVSVDALAVLQPSAFHYLMCPTGFSIYWAVGETINTGKLVTAVLQGGLY